MHSRMIRLIKIGICCTTAISLAIMYTLNSTPNVNWKIGSLLQPKNEFQLFNSLMGEYRHCLLNHIDNSTDVFHDISRIIRKCLHQESLQNLSNILEIKKFRNSDETKLAILPIDMNGSCTVVTLGIGNDTGAEESLHKILPQCQFYGADPILESGQIYKNIGQYFQVAVGAKSGIQNQSVLKGKSYHWEEVETIEYQEFLSQYAKVDRIDYLWMDAEGAEYGMMLRYFIDKIPIKVCQFNVEMHGPLKTYGMNSSNFDDLIWAMLSESPFLPFDGFLGNHIRLFFIDASDPVCLKKYYLSKFCE